MAQKKGLMYRLTVGKENLPDFTPNRLPGSRWAVFKDVFFNRLGAMVKISLLTLLFMLPALAWLVIMYLVRNVDSQLLPYSANLWLGYDVTLDAQVLGEYRNYMFNLQTYTVLVPLIVIAGLGFAGAFHVMKLLGWGEGVAVGGNFFVGIKRNWVNFLWIFLIFAVSLFVLVFNFTATDNISTMPTALRVIMSILSVIQFIFILSMTMFAATQNVTYKLGFFALLKNSFLFTIALFPFNVFFLALSLAPAVLIIFLPLQISMFLWIIYALVGISYTVLVWTVYTQWVYDKYVNDRVPGAVKNRGMYVKTPEDERAEEIERIKTRAAAYGPAYVARRLSSIDEGAGFTPLADNFNRSDLERLSEEKNAMREEIENERERLSAELAEEERAYEEEKRAAAKRGKRGGKGQDGKKNQGKKGKKSKPDRENTIATMPVSEEEYIDPDDEEKR